MDIKTDSTLDPKTLDPKLDPQNFSVLTTEQVIGLAPDKYHIRTSRNLATPEKWKQLGLANETIWGIFPIKGKPSLFTSVGLEKLSLFCDCNSRKHPCNHLLSLLLLYIDGPGSFVEREIPEEYQSLINSSGQKDKSADKPIQKEREQISSKNERAKKARTADIIRREERRKQNISAGLLELELWLHDMIEDGLAAVQDYPKNYWTTMADRLVDYQLSEIAHHIRSMSLLPGKEIDWHDTLLQRVSWLYLLIQGFKRFDDLSLEMQMDLRVAVGWMPRFDEAIATGQEQQWEAVADSWVIVGKQKELRGKQTIQRTWLWGERSNRAALLFDVVQHKQVLHIVGTTIDATLSFAPSTMPFYAQVATSQKVSGPSLSGPSLSSPSLSSPDETLSPIIQRRQSDRFVAGYESIAVAMAQYRTAVTNNPWLRYFPAAFTSVTVESLSDQWGICDILASPNVQNSKNREKDGDAIVAYLLPLPDKFEHLWHLQSLSHLKPLSLFGEWNGDLFTPLSIWYDSRLIEFRVLGGTV